MSGENKKPEKNSKNITPVDSKAELRAALLKELNRSLVVDPGVREYWLKNYQTLPINAVRYFYDNLMKANQHVDKCIDAGIDASPELVEQINLKSKAFKTKTLKFQEKESMDEENPDEFLKANLT